MRKTLLSAVVLIAFVLIPAAPGQAGGTGRMLTVEKVVVGPGPTGPYPMTVTCEVSGQAQFDLDDGEQLTLPVQNAQGDSCFVGESNTLGGTASYSCAATGSAVCDDNNIVSWEGDLTGNATITVTNTFQEPTTTTTTATTSSTQATTTTAAPRAVAVAPTFTG